MNKCYSEILKECAIIAEERQKQYGSAGKSLQVACDILKEVFGINLTVTQFAQVMVALKLSRLKFNYKRDSAVDCLNYLAIMINEYED